MAGKAVVTPVVIPIGAMSDTFVMESLVLPLVFVPTEWENSATIVMYASYDPGGPFFPMCDDLGQLIELTPLTDATYAGQGCAMRCEERLLQHVRYVKFKASSAQSVAQTIYVQTLPVRELVAAQQ